MNYRIDNDRIYITLDKGELINKSFEIIDFDITFFFQINNY